MSFENMLSEKKDFLTGCFTKENLAPVFVRLGAEYAQHKIPFSFLLIDLDHFKSLNDKYGHLLGDEVLKYFASSLRLSLGDSGIIPFRYGGDEFVIVFPGKDSRQAYALSLQLSRNIKYRPFLLKGRLFKMSFSGGVATYPKDGSTFEDLIAAADKAMYFCKRHRHGKVVQYGKIKQIKLQYFAFFVILIIAGLFLAFRYYTNKDYFSNFTHSIDTKIKSLYFRKINTRIQQKIQRQLKPLSKITANSEKPVLSLDKVYLKSGGILEGEIIRQSDDSIEVRLLMQAGEGSITVKRDEIERIEKGNLK